MVDIKDLLQLIESWDQNDPLIDIGPAPFGDGLIDAADLEVLMGYWEQEIFDPTLIAHWKLDETEGLIAYDSAGQNDATVVGVPVWLPGGGAVNGALELDGTTLVVADSVLDPSEGPFSIFAWVNGGAPGQVVASQEAGTDWLSPDPATGALMTDLRGSGRLSSALYSEAAISDGDWHRIGLIWDGNIRSLCVDDVLVAEDMQTGLQACDGGLNIGCDKAMTPDTFFSGLIDDIRIYNRAVRP